MIELKDNIESHISSAEELSEYLSKKAIQHNCYKLYAPMKRIIDIRDEQCLYLGMGDNWNDISDRISFNHQSYNFVNFGKCFSYSQDESVAMWMLYGGIDKKSGMIDFTKKGINNILSVTSIDLGCFTDKVFHSELVLNRDRFSISMIDVIYYKYNKNGYYIKRSDESCKCLSAEVFEQLVGCKKAYPWQYENECRLIISVDKRFITKDCKTVRIDLSKIDLGKSFERIYRGPNYSSNEAYGSQQSKLDNTIDWSLCEGKDCSLMKEVKK